MSLTLCINFCIDFHIDRAKPAPCPARLQGPPPDSSSPIDLYSTFLV